MAMENEIVSDEYIENESSDLQYIVNSINSQNTIKNSAMRNETALFERLHFNADKIDFVFFKKLKHLSNEIEAIWKENRSVLTFHDFVFHKVCYELAYNQFYQIARFRSENLIKIWKYILMKAYIIYIYLQNCSTQQIHTEIGKRVKSAFITTTLNDFKKKLEHYLELYFCIEATNKHTYTFIINQRDYEPTLNLQQITKSMNEKEHTHLDIYYLYFYDSKRDRQRILPIKIFPHQRRTHIIITDRLFDAKSEKIENVMVNPFGDWKKV